MSTVLGGRIPESFIQSVLAKTDIVSLIQESIQLKKTGANHGACCPFHHEKTPSFIVSQAKQCYHCFGCGAHGDAIRFLMEYQSIRFVEAVERLAARLGLAIPRDPKESARSQAKMSMSSVLNQVAEFYSAQFKKHPEGRAAAAYLQNRGLTGKLAKTYEIGFAPPGWDNLLTHFKGQVSTLRILEETGMLIKHPEGRYYDRFRHRIMFPIRDRRGDVIAFGGRVMDQSQPKYLNSPESALFQKGHCLYGIYEAFNLKEKESRAIIVEGYFDVVMLAQHDVLGALATLGTAVTTHHLNYLFQFVSEVVFCFDGDKAGRAAAEKALKLVLPLLTENRQVRFAFLPNESDPDSYVRQIGGQDFQAFIHNGMPLSEYFFATLCQKIVPNSVDNRAHLASLARPMIEEIPPGIFKEMMFERLAQLVMSSPQVVRGKKAFSYGYGYKWKKEAPKWVEPPPPSLITPAFLASALLLNRPEMHSVIDQSNPFWETMMISGIALFRQLLALIGSQPNITSSEVRKHLEAKGLLDEQLSDCEKRIALIPIEGWGAELSGALRQLFVIGQKQLAEKLCVKAKQSGLTLEEKQQLKEILQYRESIC